MRIELTTIYENVDQGFIDYYISNLQKAGLPLDFEKLKEGDVVSFSTSTANKDGMTATTKYQVIKKET